eukprot:CAMPEP_0202450088 /NCGR_PEP_ID=MMETSP1360-20130828/8737_1 /ASSEMBLY_ACC=CAM_ASM_000848 /TAXON_ID=515479 /ORGANISM="Licmophora paradoxa, Strain CCMP2313" /LENGTH=440 /DNA_ID=CAMNT_0049068227 /DNA_START=12 /DNA_END=1334 /DNA_ORIENTATION=+
MNRPVLLLILLACLLSPTLALKGSKRSSSLRKRLLKEDDSKTTKEEDEDKVDKTTTETEVVEDKVDDKVDKNCKKRDKNAPKETDDDEDEEETSDPKASKKSDDEEEDLPYCPEPEPKKSKKECDKLLKGTYPKKDNTANGKLKLEVVTSSDSDIEAVTKSIEETLKTNTALAVFGCELDERRRLDDADDFDETAVAETTMEETEVELVALSGVDFGTLVASDADCDSSNDSDCNVIKSNVTLYYTGDATSDEEQQMIDDIESFIQSQISEGTFEEVDASIEDIELALIDDDGELVTPAAEEVQTAEKSSSNVAFAGAAAVIALGLLGCCMCRRRRQALTRGELQEAHAYVDEKDGKGGKSDGTPGSSPNVSENGDNGIIPVASAYIVEDKETSSNWFSSSEKKRGVVAKIPPVKIESFRNVNSNLGADDEEIEIVAGRY